MAAVFHTTVRAVAARAGPLNGIGSGTLALTKRASSAGDMAARGLDRGSQLVALVRWRQTRLHLSAQHGQPLDNLVDDAGIEVDVDPDLAGPSQSPAGQPTISPYVQSKGRVALK